MNLFKRSFLYVIRKKRKSITLFVCLWLVASTLISGIAVKNAGLTAKKTFSRQTGSILHISSDSTDLVGDGYGSGEIPEKAIVNIASNPNVKRVNNNLMAYAGLTSEKMVTRPNDKEQYKE